MAITFTAPNKEEINDNEAEGYSNVVSYVGATGTEYWLAYWRGTRHEDIYLQRSVDLVNWDQFKWNEDEDTLGINPQTEDRPQLVVAGKYLFLFWLDVNEERLLASRYGPSTENPEVFSWSHYVDCLTIDGEYIKERGDDSTAALAVLNFGDRFMITTAHASSIYDALFFPEGFKVTGQNTWQAAEEISTPVSNGAHSIATAIASLGGINNDAGSPGQAYSMLMKSTHKDQVDWSYTIRPLSTYDNGWGLPDPKTPLTFNNFPNQTEMRYPTLSLDPGGRIIATYLDRVVGEHYLHFRVYDTSNLPDGSWGEQEDVHPDASAQKYPITFFTFGDEVQVEPGSGKPYKERPVYRWLIYRRRAGHAYGYGSDLCEFSSGVTRWLPEYEQLNVTEDSDTHTMYVQGYIDGPPPVFAGMADAFSEVSYSTTSTEASSDELVTSVQVGVKSEGSTAPSVGGGLTWDATLMLGTGGAFGVDRSDSLTENTIFELVEIDGEYAQVGLIRGAAIILCRDAYQYLPDGETPTTEGPQLSNIYLKFHADQKRSYDLGTVTVGDLYSYTAEAWSERMLQLERYKQQGITNYLRDIVIPRTVSFQGEESTLRDTWTIGSRVDEEFGSTADSYQSSSMTLESEVFIGTAGEFFGAEASFMTGFSTSIEATQKSVQSETVGVGVKLSGAPSSDTDIIGYTVITYLCEASNDWIYELIALQGDQAGEFRIEPNAECWKIMYVVDDIQHELELSELELPDELLEQLSQGGLTKASDILSHYAASSFRELLNRDNLDMPALLISQLRKWDERTNYYAPMLSVK